MSEEIINSSDSQESPGWETQLQTRAKEVINQQVGQQVSQRIGPLKNEIARLQSAIAELQSKLDEPSEPVEEEPETGGLLDYVKQWFSESSSKAEQNFNAKVEQVRAEAEQSFDQRMAQARAEWEVASRELQEAELQKRLEQACIDAAAVARREAEAKIEELTEQLEGSRQALTLAVSTQQAASTETSGFEHLKSAVEDIDAQRTQSDTLTTLVRRAAQFAPRIVFFVVKGDTSIGWKATGFENGLNDETVRLLSVPTQNQSLLREALTTFGTATGRSASAGDDSTVLGLYGSPAPETTVAVPLVVRGKAAAVLYADSGTQSESAINTAALETLMHVASMGIELLPARRGVDPVRPSGPPPQLNAPTPTPAVVPAVAPAPEPEKPAEPEKAAEPEQPAEPVAPPVEAQAAEQVQDDFADSAKVEEPEVPDRITEELSKNVPPVAQEVQERADAPTQFEPKPTPITEVPTAEVPVITPAMVREQTNSAPLPPPPPAPPAYAVQNNVAPKVEAPSVESLFTPSFTPPTPAFTSPAPEPPRPAQPVMAVPTPTSETEQRAHNDARRFARLLVSEIKLYNAARVNEGRRSLDLYDRLKDEIDRSRKVY
ncbi:MAG TPA: hypothetical protein PLQ88_28855, partial [Blastocatellia bacterium]|nr:hypothetical protein [Blastocatellia bacterium]